jgi:hypothetical protein
MTLYRMNSLPVPCPPEAPGPHLGSHEESGLCGERENSAALLDPFLYQDMRWCTDCGGERIFVEVFEFEGGRLGVCLGCGAERVIRWTRATEVAA